MVSLMTDHMRPPEENTQGKNRPCPVFTELTTS